MGIHGIYKEIGPGERIALAKLAIDKFQQTGRPLRIAIDISIWLFQIQSSKGGTNPALRTFYYRLLRLISHSIHPLFVFDGPNKPPFKRNKRTGPNVASIPEFLAKQLLKQFGLSFHVAPGEAEAECALLQREGIVDAVLSEDVDTLMFGSGITLRNWSAETAKGKVATHVNLYDAEKTKAGRSGLDREGMVLVALMSGGDYIPEGIPGCGPKLACEAARAGFGKELCSIPKRDSIALNNWRERLRHEIHTNESKLFSRKKPSLTIPDDFPNREALGYYTHPAISSADGLARLRRNLKWDQDLDFAALRSFTGDAFEWLNLGGAKKFIRNLAPALLIRQLSLRALENRDPVDNDALREAESRLVTSLHGKRTHPSTDNTTELRVAFVPHKLVPIDLDAEPPDDTVPEDPIDVEGEFLDADEEASAVPSSSVRPFLYDPDVLEKAWIPEAIVKAGVPLMVAAWDDSRQIVATKAAAKKPAKPRAKKDVPVQSRIDNTFKVRKVASSMAVPRKSSLSPELEYLPGRSVLPQSTSPFFLPRGLRPHRTTNVHCLSWLPRVRLLLR
ncbi:PIN domain-like protein [Aulographum hederae CBS 113979]|uniref:PIN domain-like protein n=1 Tax=Aulographum hederae CBS 113979 TaxID=1176131 RepID=A0A6G1GZ86_9PEZI|nr:PIN domain-like protein [Aulographum hederae CBS 113979]